MKIKELYHKDLSVFHEIPERLIDLNIKKRPIETPSGISGSVSFNPSVSLLCNDTLLNILSDFSKAVE